MLGDHGPPSAERAGGQPAGGRGGANSSKASAEGSDGSDSSRSAPLTAPSAAEADSGASLFKGRNFVFDRRLALPHVSFGSSQPPTIVGRCSSCAAPYDSYDSKIFCASCRALVLVCEVCRRHQAQAQVRKAQFIPQCGLISARLSAVLAILMST